MIQRVVDSSFSAQNNSGFVVADSVVREMKGPFSDPQHPYMYDEEDMWMAPGFINQFYPVSSLLH